MNVRSLLPSRRIVNMFGAIGYSVLIISYAIAAGTILLWLMRTGYGEAMGVIPPAPIESAEGEVSTQIEAGGASLLVSILAYAVTIVMTLTVLFVLVTLPYWLGKSGSYLLKRLIRLFAISVTPLTLLLAKLIANGMVIVPILLIVAEDIANILTLLLVAGLVGVTMVLFLLQHYLARMNHLEAKEIW